MSRTHNVICFVTLLLVMVSSQFVILVRREMDAALDRGKVGSGAGERLFRDVVKEYKRWEPGGELLKRYRRYLFLTGVLMLFLAAEAILFNR
jgi:hypothetical protein